MSDHDPTGSDPTLDRPSSPAAAETVAGSFREGPGTRIGPYRLLQLVGEGGFGSVFMAEQEKPVSRKVALKIIKLGMDTRQVVARFEQERQALAMMDHPNIAKVLDAGATDTGRPFFVMELVKGDPIVEYCDKNNLSIHDRLEIFAQVCQAVQHAHTKGIIHRDIKPSNILVSTQDGKPHTKVIDFGIAKATASKLTEKTLFTEHRQLIGTPEYMSPEQAEGNLDIDTRTDVYSLGVLLYELLTGTTPFTGKELRSAAFGELQRIIREVEPPNPSTRLSSNTDTIASVAARRQTEPKRLGSIVRGELDWIVMKAMEKDRQRRYETANGLAMDIRRYLSGEAVVAAPPSTAYRFKKFVRRNRGPVAATAAVAGMLLLGLIGTAYGLRQALVARDGERDAKMAAQVEAERAVKAEAETKARADELRLVSNFQAGMLEQIDPTKAGKELTEDIKARFAAALAKSNPDMPEPEKSAVVESFATQLRTVNATDAARELIDRTILKPAIETIDKRFKDQPLVDAQLRQTLAVRYLDLGLYDASMPLQTNALATRRRLLGEEHPDTLDSLSQVATLLHMQGKFKEAEPLYREVLDKRRRVLGEDDPETLGSISNVGTVLQDQTRYAEAEPFLREAVERYRRVRGEEHESTLSVVNNLGTVLYYQAKYDECEPYFRESLDKKRRLLGEEHPQTVTSINNMGLLRKAQGKFSEAEVLFREAAEGNRRLRGEEHPETLISMMNLGGMLQTQGKLADAEAIFRDALEKLRRVRGEGHPHTLTALSTLGVIIQAQGRTAEAEPFHQEALEKQRRYLGADHPTTLTGISNMGALRQAQGRLDEAEGFYREALETRRRVLGEEHLMTMQSVTFLAGLHTIQGKHAEVVAMLAPMEARARKVFTGPNAWRLGFLLMNLGQARAGLAKEPADFAAAEANLLEAQGVYVKSRGELHKDTRGSAKALADFYDAWHKAEPGNGFDSKAAEWRKKPETMTPTEKKP